MANKYSRIFQSFKIYWNLFYGPEYTLSLWAVPYVIENSNILQLLDVVASKSQLGRSDSFVHSLIILSIAERGMFKYPTMLFDLFIILFNSVKFWCSATVYRDRYSYIHIYMLLYMCIGIYIYICSSYISLMNLLIYHCEMSLSLVILLMYTLTDINIVITAFMFIGCMVYFFPFFYS